MALGLASCEMPGGPTKKTDPTTPASGQEAKKLVDWYELDPEDNYDGSNVTINFWHRMGEANQQILQKWIGEFNAIYPNITVNEEKKAEDYDGLEDKIALAITTKTTPHISESYPDHISRYAPAKVPLALNNFINHPIIGYTEEEIADFLPGLWAEGASYDMADTILSMPFTKSTEALYYNKAYFDKHGYTAPTTWEELFTIARDIKTREPNSRPFGYDSGANLFISASEQWDAPYTGYDAEGNGQILFNNDSSKEMVKYFKARIDEGLMTTRALSGGSYTSDQMKLGHTVYMFVGSTGGARYSVNGVTAEVFQGGAGYQVGVAAVPSNEGNKAQIQQGPNINLYQKANKQEMIASWLFTKFILEAERTAEFALQSGYAPIRYTAYETEEWLTYIDGIVENPTTVAQAEAKAIADSIEMFRDNQDGLFTSAVFNLSSKTRTQVDALIGNIFAYEETGQALDTFIDREYTRIYNFIIR